MEDYEASGVVVLVSLKYSIRPTAPILCCASRNAPSLVIIEETFGRKHTIFRYLILLTVR